MRFLKYFLLNLVGLAGLANRSPDNAIVRNKEDLARLGRELRKADADGGSSRRRVQILLECDLASDHGLPDDLLDRMQAKFCKEPGDGSYLCIERGIVITVPRGIRVDVVRWIR